MPPEVVVAARSGEVEEGGEAAAGTEAGAAAAGAAGSLPILTQSRRRPLIFVYDLPPAYNARMLQYRNDR